MPKTSKNQTANGKGASCHGGHKDKGAQARSYRRRIKRTATSYSYTRALVRIEGHGPKARRVRIGSVDYNGRDEEIARRYYPKRKTTKKEAKACK